jgi:thiol-disulfide isomerase/thioredoxin
MAVSSQSGQSGPAPKSWALKAAGYVALLGVAAFLYVVFAATSKPPAQGFGRFAEGSLSRLQVSEDVRPQPGDAFTGPDGERMTLASFHGDVVVVNYWATFCAPCIAEMPTLARLQGHFGNRLRVIPISIDEGAAAQRARSQLADLTDGQLPFYLDITRGVFLNSGSGFLPLTVVYDRSGQEVARLEGDADWSSPQAIALLEAVLADQPG